MELCCGSSRKLVVWVQRALSVAETLRQVRQVREEDSHHITAIGVRDGGEGGVRASVDSGHCEKLKRPS